MESESRILQAVTDRIGSDSSEHQAIVERTNSIFAPYSEDKDDPRNREAFFLRVDLSGGKCILVRDPRPLGGTDMLQWKNITYRLAPTAIRDWPFSVFDLDRDCLPAVLNNSGP
jgi:hypothetical protein